MSKDKITKLNIVDWLAVVTVLMFSVLIVVIAGQPERDLGEPALLTVRVDNNVETIFPEATKKGTVYLNGVSEPSTIVDTLISGSTLEIVVEGRGAKNEEGYIFNGQRILIGQKAELHGSFWAQGTVTGLELK